MTYPEAIQFLESFINYEKIPDYPYKESIKLERVKGFLAAINSPQEGLKCLHIAGTKGKGSTCAFIAFILRHAGYKVGLYTSPHLSDFRERIRILEPQASGRQMRNLEDFEGMIPSDELAALTERLRPKIQEYNENSKYGLLTFFEVYTSLAFMYFKEKKVDLAVLETGLGGRLDATNTATALVDVITPLSYEHTDKLGQTLKEIATEKAGIIKNRCQVSGVRCQPIVISAPQQEEAAQVIRNRCLEVGAKLYEVGKDITYQKMDDEFKIKGILRDYAGLKIGLLGEHQLVNAAAAVGAIEALKRHNIDVGFDAIKSGLDNTVWPGRCEAISRNPLVILDGAQNIASMAALKEAIRHNFKYKKLILVLGISSDKDVKGICSEIYGLADEVILTRANNPRATYPSVLARYFRDKAVNITDSVNEANKLALHIGKKEDLILICGSLFVVGESRTLLKGAG